MREVLKNDVDKKDDTEKNTTDIIHVDNFWHLNL